ncbi:MAG: Magnesium transporter MgtE [Chlamydiae bacterium]|nr:Magnesium transporter MgtE [Chlamydiota bacterium]
MKIDTNKRIKHQDLEAPISHFATPFPYTFTIEQTVGDVLHTLQSEKHEFPPEYFYITDKDQVLQGILDIRDLPFSPPKTCLVDLVETEVKKVYEEDSLENGLDLMTRNKLLIIPVVNREEKFVGTLEIIPHTENPKRIGKRRSNKRLREDLFQFIGFSIEQKRPLSPWLSFRYRMPWLLCNLIGGLICAVISELYQATLVAFVLLAFFIPLVLTLSESVAIQSMTLSLRFLHTRKIDWAQVGRRLFHEGKSSLLLGLVSALIIVLFYFAWSTEILPLVAIGVSVIVAMMCAALFGGFFPIILHALRLDPKVAAGPVVLMMADVFTIAIYLSLSTLLLM